MNTTGKNKKGNLIPAAHTSNAFLQLKEAYKTRFGTYPKDEDPVFCDAVGNRLVSLNKPLNQLLKAAGLLHNSAGEKISTYCFRHTYATWQLQKSDAVDIYTLAINMRTSVEMIENYYSKLIAEDKADKLRGNPFSDKSAADPRLKFRRKDS